MERCEALSDTGRRCRRISDTMRIEYHGDHEIYGHGSQEPSWVLVALCVRHRNTDAIPYEEKGVKS